MATLLVEKGANVSLKGHCGCTPLHFSAEHDSINVAKLLLNKSSDELNTMDNAKNTPLHLAAERDSLRVATLLVERGANVSLKGYYGTPLHQAARHNSINVAKLLLNKSCDAFVNARDNDNSTSLMLAEWMGPNVLELFQTVSAC